MHCKEGPPYSHEQNVSRLFKSIENLRKEVNPRTVTDYWQVRFEIDGPATGLEITVPEYPLTQEELVKKIKRRAGEVSKQMIYLPNEFTGPEGLVRFGKTYGHLLKGDAKESYTLLEKPEIQVTDNHNTSGWIGIEATNRPPNTDTTENDLREFADATGYFMQREVVYAFGSIMFHDIHSQFFDNNGTWSRLGGSEAKGGVIAACFRGKGFLWVKVAADRNEHSAKYGGRFEQPLRR